MSKSRTPRNRSARSRRLAREASARASRSAQRAPGSPWESRLSLMRPPFRGYESWITVTPPAGVPDGALDGLSPQVAGLMGTVRRLAPLYEYEVPMAALTLERLISRGLLPVASPETPGRVSLVPVADLVEICAADEVLQTAPGDLDAMLHELHCHGALVVDDDQVIRLTVPA